MTKKAMPRKQSIIIAFFNQSALLGIKNNELITNKSLLWHYALLCSTIEINRKKPQTNLTRQS